MEQPPPPPGMDYNAFRRYRTTSGIRGTAQELADAWRTYAGSVEEGGAARGSPRKSPTRASPTRGSTRTSPTRSPVRYGGLSSASLTGLPPDVLRMATAGVGKRAVGSLRVASRHVGRFTDAELHDLCMARPSISELLGALPHLRLPVYVNVVVFAVKATQYETPRALGNMRVIVVADPWRRRTLGRIELVGLEDAKAALVELRDMAEVGDRLVYLNPRALSEVLLRRLSCAKVRPDYAAYVHKKVHASLLYDTQQLLRDTLHIRLGNDAVRRVREILEGNERVVVPVAAFHTLAVSDHARIIRRDLQREMAFLTGEPVALPDLLLPPEGDEDEDEDEAEGIRQAINEIANAQVDRIRRLYREV